MSNNPFAVASNAAPAAPAAPSVTDVADVSELVEGSETPARKKSDKPRKPRNRTITDTDKKQILVRYANEATGDIAKDLGLTRAQVYNVVRNTRKDLEKNLEDPTVSAELKERIQAALAKLPKKESSFGGGAAGPRKKPDLNDILADFGL